MLKLKIGLDIDEVLAQFWDSYLDRFGQPKSDREITWNCNQKLARDKNFWLALPVLRRIEGFEPALYCTKRSCLKSYTKEWLNINEFPNKPVYQVLCQTSNKASYIKGRVDIFIDDSPSNFIQMNKSGVPCLLMDSPYNQDLGPMLRIYTLDYEEIADTFNLAKELDIFNNFREYYD